MTLDEKFIREEINKAFDKGYFMMKDHRNNIISLEKGIFIINNFTQTKSKDTIISIFLEALKLTRQIECNNKKYVRKRSKWIEKPI